MKDLIEVFITGGVYQAPAVIDQPGVKISSWQVFQAMFEDGSTSRHLIGVPRGGSDGRVTSAIATYDSEKGQILTSSGRLYTLVGDSSYSNNALYVWGEWKFINGVKSETDVSLEYHCKSGE